MSAASVDPRLGHVALVAPSAVDAVALLPAFDDVHLVRPDELADALSTGRGVALVVVAGVPRDNDQLAQVISTVLAADGEVNLAVSLGDDAGRSLIADATPLRGLVLRSVASMAGVRCAFLARAEQVDAVPRIPDDGSSSGASSDDDGVIHDAFGISLVNRNQELVDEIADLTAQYEKLQNGNRELREKLEKLLESREQALRDLRAMRTSVFGRFAAVESRLRRGGAAGLGSGARQRRLVKLALVAGIGLLVVAGFSTGMALLTSTGYVGGVLTGLVLFIIPALAFLALRGRRTTITLSKHMKLSHRRFGSIEESLREYNASALKQMRAAQAQTQRDQPRVEVLAAAIVDIAKRVAAVQETLGDPAVNGRPNTQQTEARPSPGATEAPHA